MHEMAITRSVVDIVVDKAQAMGATRVGAVYLTIGELRDIVESIFVDMFGWMARGTVAENAKVVIKRVPLMVKCRRCGDVYHLDVHDDSTWPCARCGVRDYDLVSGNEFMIDNLEVSTRPLA